MKVEESTVFLMASIRPIHPEAGHLLAAVPSSRCRVLRRRRLEARSLPRTTAPDCRCAAHRERHHGG